MNCIGKIDNMTKGREPRTEKEWDSYFKSINELELNMRNQNIENESTMTWGFSMLKLEGIAAYARWKAKRGLK